MALRALGIADRVVGVDRDAEVLARAVALGAIDEGSLEFASIAAADCIVFATPAGILPEVMERAASFVRPDAAVTDTGSVKQRIVQAGERLFGARFVGGHPMAGSEASGVDAARADLFEGAPWVLTTAQTSGSAGAFAAARIGSLVVAVGARPVYLTPGVHDHLAGLVSHLPHVLSFAFARTVAADPGGAIAMDLAGGSYRDLMRVSHSSPELWSQILIENRDLLLPIIASFETSLHSLHSALEATDTGALRSLLTGTEKGSLN
jgi:prephenate dehydrogenase